MINGVLSAWTPGPFELLFIFIIGLIVFGIPVILIVLFVRYVLRSNKERQRLRLELGKLADELQQMRKQKEEGAKRKSSADSE